MSEWIPSFNFLCPAGVPPLYIPCTKSKRIGTYLGFVTHIRSGEEDTYVRLVDRFHYKVQGLHAMHNACPPLIIQRLAGASLTCCLSQPTSEKHIRGGWCTRVRVGRRYLEPGRLVLQGTARFNPSTSPTTCPPPPIYHSLFATRDSFCSFGKQSPALPRLDRYTVYHLEIYEDIKDFS